jgi:hypothetical protein
VYEAIPTMQIPGASGMPRPPKLSKALVGGYSSSPTRHPTLTWSGYRRVIGPARAAGTHRRVDRIEGRRVSTGVPLPPFVSQGGCTRLGEGFDGIRKHAWTVAYGVGRW